jgi:hypothetical protein
VAKIGRYVLKKRNNNVLQGLQQLLPALSQQQGWEEKLDLHSIFLNWDELLDEDMVSHCQPQKIVKNVLWIEAENSAWLQQFQFQTVLILERLNRSLRCSRLKGLRFYVAEKAFEKAEDPQPSLRYVRPPAKDVTAFEEQIASIADEESRESLLRFWYLSQAWKKE